ncbi:MAG: hypothetical protein R6V50_06220 [Thermoplasmatota archaeon]
MNQLAKTQLAIAVLAFFSTMWSFVKQLLLSTNILNGLVQIGVLFVVLLVLSIIILGILEWVRLFDLKVNSLLTLIVLIAIGFSAAP